MLSVRAAALTFVAIVLCFTPVRLAAQEHPYVSTGSVGSTQNSSAFATPTYDASRPFLTLQPSQWIGKRFIFLFAPKETRQWAYSDFQPALDYRQYVGRIARVDAIDGPDYGSADHPSSVHLTLEDNGEKLSTRCLCPRTSVVLGGMALVDEIDQARRAYNGHTLWLSFNSPTIETYDAAADESHSITVPKYSAVTVKDIVGGSSSSAPLRFILRTSDGTEGYVDVNLSNTNQGTTSHLYHFEDKFLTTDPHLQYKWPSKTWDAIAKGEISNGMTPDQVRMAWGNAQDVTNPGSSMEWRYASGSVVRFTNGVVSSVSN